MMNRIIKFALDNRSLILVLSIALLVYGTYIAVNMEVDVFPDLTAPTVVVLTECKGMAPEEVEQLVSFPIEATVNGSQGVRRVRSNSSTGFSIVWVEFDWGTDIFKARQVVNEKLQSISGQLPDGIGVPTMAPQSSLMGEIMYVTLTSDSVNSMELRSLADWVVRPRLLSIGGVAQIAVIGGEIKQYQLLIDPYKMKFHNVSLNEVTESLQDYNSNATGNLFNEFGNEYIIRGLIRTENINDLSNVVIKFENNYPIRVSDIAEITIGPAFKIGDGSFNGLPAVIMTITKQPNINTIELTNRINESIDDISKNLPDGIKMNTDVFRQSDFIETAINNVQGALIEGAIFVSIILFLFLMNIRTTFISLIAIPLSLLVSVLTLHYFNLTINTMSLGGMAIAIGILVDDAIIDVENVFKRLKQNYLLPVEQRAPNLEVVYTASKEVRASILNATLIIIASFTPLFFLSGMEGKLLIPLGIAFVVSLFASLIVAITLTPVLCSYLLINDKTLNSAHKDSFLQRNLNRIYQRLVAYLLDLNNFSKRLIIAVAVLLILGSIFIMTNLGRSFLPEFNEGTMTVTAITLPGISLEESNKIGSLIERELLAIPEIKLTNRRTGRAELDEHAFGVNTSEIDAPFEIQDRPASEIFAEARERLGKISGVGISLGQPISHRIDHILSGTRANVAIKLYGTDLKDLYQYALSVQDAIKEIDGLVDINVEQQIEIPQVHIKPDRDLLTRYGIPLKDFSRFIETAFSGVKVSEVFEGNRRFDIIVRYDNEHRDSFDGIKNTLIDASNGQKVAFGNVAEIKSALGPNTISRENVSRMITISANVAGRDLRSTVNEIKTNVANEVNLPEGYHIVYGGQFESEEQASRILLLTSLLAFIIIVWLLYSEFRSLKITLLILVNLPLALIGGIMILLITSSELNIPAIIGFITLFGVATRNGILLISRYNHLIADGYAVKEAVMLGSVDRLSPILMTALTAALALLPLAISGQLPGNEIQSPMAKVILGGLLTSTILNLIIVPLIFFIIEKRDEQIIS